MAEDMPSFDEVIDGATTAGGRMVATVPPDWLQGRTAFGGLTAALCIRALRAQVEVPLASVDVAFIAPIPAGEVAVDTRVLRRGKRVTTAEATLFAGGALAARLYAVFAHPSPASRIVVPAPALSSSRPPSDAVEIPYLPGVMPAFTQHVVMRLADGALPFSGARGPGSSSIGGWCRHRTRATGIEALVALVDVWPAPVLQIADAPFFASTVRWSCHLTGDVSAELDDEMWYRGDTVVAGGGFATTTAHLYAGERLVAWSEQLVALYD